MLYTGMSETTDLIIQGQTGISNPYPSFFDAGAYGGLEIKGDISVSKYQGGMERLVLTGSNTVPCSITGQLLAGDQQNNGKTGGFFFIKRGTGTWRFADFVSGNTLNDGKRDNRTTMTIEEVQRAKSKTFGKQKVNSTFLAGHFKAYTLKLTSMDGVFYCDLRPNMKTDPFLAERIYGIDRLFYDEVRKFGV